MHLLFLDESGTHSGSPALIVGGVSLHESHLANITQRLDGLMESALASRSVDPADYEFHAVEMKSPQSARNKPGARKRKESQWLPFPQDERIALLEAAYGIVGSVRCGIEWHSCGLFGTVLDAKFHKDDSVHDREQTAYETLLNKFDRSLQRDRRESLGLVIHDERLVAQRDIQTWTRNWQDSAGKLRRLERLALVPFFADSKGSRLLQAADLVSWALNRYYVKNDAHWIEPLWSQFDFYDGHMHGAIHLTPAFKQHNCVCPPCSRRSDHDFSPLESAPDSSEPLMPLP